MVQTLHMRDDRECKTSFPKNAGFFVNTGACYPVRGNPMTFSKVECNTTHTTIESGCRNAYCGMCEKVQTFRNGECIRDQPIVNYKHQCVPQAPKIEETGIYIRHYANPACTSPRGTIGSFLTKETCITLTFGSLKENHDINFVIKDPRIKSTKVFYDNRTKHFYQQGFSEENCKGEKLIEQKSPLDICERTETGLLPWQKHSRT